MRYRPELLRGLRLEAGLSQDKLGHQVGVTDKTIGRWETGQHMPGADQLGLLAAALGVCACAFFERRAGDVECVCRPRPRRRG